MRMSITASQPTRDSCIGRHDAIATSEPASHRSTTWQTARGHAQESIALSWKWFQQRADWTLSRSSLIWRHALKLNTVAKCRDRRAIASAPIAGLRRNARVSLGKPVPVESSSEIYVVVPGAHKGVMNESRRRAAGRPNRQRAAPNWSAVIIHRLLIVAPCGLQPAAWRRARRCVSIDGACASTWGRSRPAPARSAREVSLATGFVEEGIEDAEVDGLSCRANHTGVCLPGSPCRDRPVGTGRVPSPCRVWLRGGQTMHA